MATLGDGDFGETMSKPGMPRITPGFNLILMGSQALYGFLTFLASDRGRSHHLFGILLSTSLDLVRFLVVIMLVAWAIREFWRRLVTDLFPVRPIDFQESLSIALMAGLLFGR